MAAAGEPVRIVMLREGEVARWTGTKRTQIDQIAHCRLDDRRDTLYEIMQDPGQEESCCLGEIPLSPPLADGQQIATCIFSRFFQFVIDPWKEAVLACRYSRHEIVQHFAHPIEVFLIDILDGRDECQYFT